MGSTVSHIDDKIKEHGSLEKYQKSLKVVVHCSTWEVSKAVLAKVQEFGFSWPGLSPMINGDTFWWQFERNTCYYFEGKEIQYSHVNHYKEFGFTVILGEEYLSRF
jgi:hypothetical protein